MRPRPRVGRRLRICCRHPRLRRRLRRPLFCRRRPLWLLRPVLSIRRCPLLTSDRRPSLVVHRVHFASFSILALALAFASCPFSAVLSIEILGYICAFGGRRRKLASTLARACRWRVTLSLAVAARRASCLSSAFSRGAQPFRVRETSAVIACHRWLVFAFALPEGVEIIARLPLLLLPLLLLGLWLRLGLGLSEPGICSSPGILRLSFGLPPIIRAVGGRLR